MQRPVLFQVLVVTSAIAILALLSSCERGHEEHRRSKLIERLPQLTTACRDSVESGTSDRKIEALSGEVKAEIEKALEKKGILRASSQIGTRKGDVFIVGGFDGENDSDRTWFWNMEKRVLKDGPKMLEARCFANVFQLKDGRFLVSGGRRVGRILDSVEISNPSSNQFSHLCDLYFPRSDHSVAQFSDHELFVSGGYTEDENADYDGLTSSIEVIDLNGMKRVILGKLRQPRFSHVTYVLGNDLIVTGGFSLFGFGSDKKRMPIDGSEKCSITMIRERFKQAFRDR